MERSSIAGTHVGEEADRAPLRHKANGNGEGPRRLKTIASTTVCSQIQALSFCKPPPNHKAAGPAGDRWGLSNSCSSTIADTTDTTTETTTISTVATTTVADTSRVGGCGGRGAGIGQGRGTGQLQNSSSHSQYRDVPCVSLDALILYKLKLARFGSEAQLVHASTLL